MRGNCGSLRLLFSNKFASENKSTHAFQYFYNLTNNNLNMCKILFMIIMFISISSTQGGPVFSRHRRMIREVYTDLNVEPQNNTEISGEKCLLDGLQVPQATAICQKKNGCRAIQKTGYCCPDYHCECERDGKIYESGEKLVDPETPCTVCYCQGGEILCNSITCYNRNDCEPKYVPGRCCPEYDNCPPLDELLSTTTKSTVENKSIPVQSTLAPKPIQEVHNNNPLGIKIKEITKPEEIRIIDEKTKVIYPTIKANNNGNNLNLNLTKNVATQTESEKLSPQLSSTTTTTESTSEIENTSEEDLKTNISSTSENPISLDSNDDDDDENASNNDSTHHDEDSQKTVRNTEKLNQEEFESNSSKQFVIVDGNGQSKPIHVKGTEGLQRGDEMDEDNNHNGTNSKENLRDSNEVIIDNNNDDDDIEPEVAGSEINVHVSAIEPTTEGIPGIASSSTSKEVYDTMLYTSEPETSDEKNNSTVFETIYHSSSEIVTTSLSATDTSTSKSSHNDDHHKIHHSDDDDLNPIESNPAYPTIDGEDLSIYGREVLTQALADDDDSGHHKSKSAIQLSTTEGSIQLPSSSSASEFSLVSISSSETLTHENIESISPAYGEERAPGEPFLIPEWERNSTDSTTTTTNQNDTDGSSEDEWKNQPIIDVDPGSGSGLGQLTTEILLPLQKHIIDEEIEASADNAADINLDLSSESSTNSENRISDSNIMDPEQLSRSIIFQNVLEQMHGFGKSYRNLFKL